MTRTRRECECVAADVLVADIPDRPAVTAGFLVKEGLARTGHGANQSTKCSSGSTASLASCSAAGLSRFTMIVPSGLIWRDEAAAAFAARIARATSPWVNRAGRRL